MLSRLIAIVDEKGMSIDFNDDDVAVNFTTPSWPVQIRPVLH
jgi:hypothetical protein